MAVGYISCWFMIITHCLVWCLFCWLLVCIVFVLVGCFVSGCCGCMGVSMGVELVEMISIWF